MGMVLLSSCSNEDDKKLNGIKLVPKDAHVVVEFNVEDVVSLIDGSQKDGMIKKLERYLDMIPIPGMKNKAKEILNNPPKMGIKLGEPIYISEKTVSFKDEPYFYVTGSLSDVRNFESVVATFTSVTPENYEGINYFDADKLFIFYTKDAFLATNKTSAETPASLKNRVVAIFNQESYFSETGVYAQMTAQQGLIRVGVDFAPYLNRKEFKDKLNEKLSISGESIEELKDAKMSMALSLYKGEVSLKYNIKCSSPKINEECKNLESLIDIIEEEYAKYFDNKEVENQNCNDIVKGEKIYASLNKGSLAEAITEKFNSGKYQSLALTLFEEVDCIELISSQSILNGELKLVMKDKTKNPIELTIEKFMSKGLKFVIHN